MTPRFTFQRRLRTPTSEQYNVYDGRASADHAMAQVDIHYPTPELIEASMILFGDIGGDLEELLAALDDDLLFSAGTDDLRANVVVFQGKEIGFYEFHAGQQIEREPELPDDNDVI